MRPHAAVLANVLASRAAVLADHRAARFGAGLALCALVLPGCGAAGSSDAPVVRDSAGVRIVENAAPGERVAFVLDAEPAVSIGSLDGPPEYMFEGVADAARLADGGIVVADANELKFYDAAGAHRVTAGGEGEGPGEFSYLNAVVPCGDVILAGDMRQQHLSVFDRQGTFLRTRPLPASGSPVFALFLEGCDDATGLPLLRVPMTYSPTDPEGTRTDTVILLRPDSSWAGADTAASLPAVVRTGGMGTSFDPAMRYAFDGADIHVAYTESIAVRTYDRAGTLERIARVPHQPRPVSAGDQQRAIEARLADVPASFAERLRPELEAATPPTHMPAAGSLLADATGRVWIQRFSAPWEDRATDWLVLDRDGALLGSVQLPPGFRPLDIGEDWILGVWENDLDVPFVRLYRFQ